MQNISVNFTKNAEALLEGETALHKITFGAYLPNVGDRLSVKTVPTGNVVQFVCVERRFDFSVTGEPVLSVLFDVAP